MFFFPLFFYNSILTTLPPGTGSLLPAPQSLLELGGSHSNLEDPLPSPVHVGTSPQSPSSLLPCPPASNLSMSQSVSTSGEGAASGAGATPSPFPGGLPLCFTNPVDTPQTICPNNLSFCTLVQNYRNIPKFENTLKFFSFQTPPVTSLS